MSYDTFSARRLLAYVSKAHEQRQIREEHKKQLQKTIKSLKSKSSPSAKKELSILEKQLHETIKAESFTYRMSEKRKLSSELKQLNQLYETIRKIDPNSDRIYELGKKIRMLKSKI